MILLILLSVALTLLVVVQNSKGNTVLVAQYSGAKTSGDLVTKLTYSLGAGVFLFSLILF